MSEELRAQIRAQLTGPGGPFEIVEEDVLGERMQVLKNRPRHLRELLVQSGVHADREHIVDGEWRVTFAAMQRHAASLARALEERYGVRKGDRVAVLAANCAAWPITWWATVSMGGIVAALNGWWTRDEIEYGISDSEPRLLIGDRKRLERLAGRDPGVPIVEIESEFRGLLEHAPDAALPDVEIDEDDPALILYTSGTTGRPKGAVNSHRGLIGFLQINMVSGAETMMYDAQVHPGIERPEQPEQQVCLATSPMFHVSGLHGTLLMQLTLGGKMVIRHGRFEEEEVLALMERERITQWTAIGAMGPRIVAHPSVGKYDLSSVVNAGFGGAPASPALQDAIRKVFPNAASSVGIGYGSSESVAVVAGIRGGDYYNHPESTGRVSATFEVEIRDEKGQPVPEGAEGEIWVRSAYSMPGYWRNPGATSKTFGPGRWMSMGDIGHFEGDRLYINSRARDMILVSAENVYPVEIEYRIDAHPAVRESAVVGVDDPVTGQAVQAVVVLQDGARAGAEELTRWVGETLAPYKVPKHWEIRREPLPRNPAGKILKNALTGEGGTRFVED